MTRRGRAAAAAASLTAVVLLTATAGAAPTFRTPVSLSIPRTASSPPAAYLDAVSCLSPGNCTAVGSVQRSAKHVGDTSLLVDTESDGTWRPPTSIAAPAAVDYANLVAVSCGAAGSCMAVGQATDGTSIGTVPIVVNESGGVWGAATTAIPTPAGTNSPQLESVWCATDGDCVALGADASPSSSSWGFTDVESGGTWSSATATPAPKERTAVAQPTALSCTSLTSCVLVGYFEDDAGSGAFEATESGGVWGAFTPISGSVDTANVTALSCSPSGTICAAVGTANPGLFSHLEVPLAIVDLDGRWSRPTVLPVFAPAAANGALVSVACTGASTCVAVGSVSTEPVNYPYVDTFPDEPLEYAFVGGAWSAPTVPSLPRTSGGAPSWDGTLGGVACAGTSSCVGVGDSQPALDSRRGVAYDFEYPYAQILSPVGRPGPPRSPSALSLHVVGRGTLLASWEQPVGGGGVRVVSYEVLVHATGVVARRCHSTRTTCTFHDLPLDRTYEVQVRARNAAGLTGPPAVKSLTMR